MVYCDHCLKDVPGTRYDGDGVLCCSECAKLLEESNLTDGIGFEKNTNGESKVSGQFVKSVAGEFSASRERTLYRASYEIQQLSSKLGVSDESVDNQALAFYRIALERNFTRGRKSEYVHAACLYIAFRENNKPYLLIDFSNQLRTNVYALGAVFLQLCKELSLQEHPIVQKPVDPSLFIYKYTSDLFGRKNYLVAETALNIIACMKRDWMQTGRKPSGLCGAALYISALAHGFKISKSQILSKVYICEATLDKRLVEFEDTESASLTIEELKIMVREQEKNPIKIPDGGLKKFSSMDLLCEHKDGGVPYFACGLCETCYKDLDKLSGGLSGGLDPPAFQRAERERMSKSQSEESANKSDDVVKGSHGSLESCIEELHAYEPNSIRENVHMATKDGESAESDKYDTHSESLGESESLSDIDDEEVDGYFLNEEEKNMKKILWEDMNREYLEEEEAAKKAEANFENCSEDLLAARELAQSVASTVAKSRKEKRQIQLEEEKSLGPAQTPLDATSRMLKRKRLESKVNFNRLAELFETEASENPEKELVSEWDKMKNDDELGPVSEVEDGNMDEEYDYNYDQENAEETYDYGYGYDDDGYNYDC